jgi:preprotein translocase subunit SecG
MASPPQRPRQWFLIRGSLLLPLLAVTLLVPVAILFVQTRQSQGEEESFAQKERHGIQYLQALYQVTTALMDAQSAAVAGRSVPADALSRAVIATTAVDDRLGSGLSTRDRWSGVRAKIEALPSRNLKDPETIYSAYGEAASLLVALYAKVRENSELIRDPDADAYFLEDGAAEELPQSVVAAGRLADLAVIAPARPTSQRTNTIADLTTAKGAVSSPVSDLTEDLQAAADGTKSRTLSGNLLSRLDIYQRNMDKLTVVTSPLGSDKITVDAATLAGIRTDVQSSATGLGGAILTELDSLIASRLDGLTTERLITVTTGTAATLLTLAAIALGVLSRRRREQSHRPDAAGGQPGPAAVEDQNNYRGVPPEWPDPGPNGGLGAEPGIRYPVGADIDRTLPAGWERSGAR